MSKAKFITPKGELRWATINGKGKQDLNGRDIYTIDVVCSMSDAEEAVAELEALWEEHKPKGAKAAKSMGYRVSEDGQQVTFTLKTSTTYPSGDAKEIAVYNAKADRVKLADKIGNGSQGRASGMAAVYDAGVAARGVTLYLDAVQITKLVKYEGTASFEADADGDFDGTDDSDGFVAENF